MSEAAPNPPAETKPEEGKKPAPAGPALPVLLGAAGGALVVGAVLGLFVIGPIVVKSRQPATAEAAAAQAEGHGKKKGEKGKKGKEGGAALFKLENIIVNPAGSQGARFVMATVAFELEDEKQSEYMREKEVQLRDRVVGVIEGQTLEALTLPGARDTLRARITRAVEPVIREEVPHYDVFLPAFVIQ